MPQESPQIGELWRMSDVRGRDTRAVIADVNERQVILVSFTGLRLRHAPVQFHMLWRFAQPTPRTGLSCTRRSCAYVAVFRWRRDAIDEYVCARHAPSGIQLEYLTDVPPGVIASPSHVEVICPSCASPDPTEDLALPRPGRVPWSWWSCHLCGRAWVTVAAPPADLIGAVLRGHWYHAQVISALSVVTAIGTVDRIEAGRAALGDMRSTPSPDPERFSPDTTRLVLEIEPTVVHIVMRSRPLAVRPTGRPLMGVARIGGRPNRPSVEGAPSMTRFQGLAQVVNIRPPEPSVAEVPSNPEVAAPNPTVHELVPENSKWRRVGGAEIVQVLGRERGPGGDVVRMQKGSDPFPVMMLIGDFTAAYTPLDGVTEEQERLYASIQTGQQWSSPREGDVTIQAKNERRHTITVNRSDGTPTTLGVREFQDMKQIIRRTAYERLVIPPKKV